MDIVIDRQRDFEADRKMTAEGATIFAETAVEFLKLRRLHESVEITPVAMQAAYGRMMIYRRLS